MQVLQKKPSLENRDILPVGKGNHASISNVQDISEVVRKETLEALVQSNVIRPEERNGFEDYLVKANASSGDIFPLMAELRGVSETNRTQMIEQWARAVSSVVKCRYPLIPFATKLLGSVSIYEQFEQIHKLASMVKCPLVFAEDSDVLGFGTVNPVAGSQIADYVSRYLEEKTGSRPFISIFLLDFDSWDTICGRQFES